MPPSLLPDSWVHVVDSLEEGIIIIDPQDLITFFNPPAEQLTGLSRAQTLSHPYSQVFAADPWVVDIVQRALESGYSRTAGEGELFGRNQRPTPIRLTCSPMFDSGTNSLGLILVLHDLTAQRELAEEMQRQDRLAHLGTMAAGLAHEIKNPLAGIRGAAQLLQSRVREDESAVEYATVMIREIDRLSGLLERLLQFSAKPPFDPQPVNIHKILTDVLLLEREVLQPGVEIRTHFDPSLPDVLGDNTQLAQVFRNLVRNGLEALGNQRGGILNISTRMATDFHLLRSAPGIQSLHRDQLSIPKKAVSHRRVLQRHPPDRAPAYRGRFLSVDFSDNGPGISAEDLPSLFIPFFTTKSQGTGLGLSISQQIVAQHGGTIRVESTSGQGTLFHVYLPVPPL